RHDQPSEARQGGALQDREVQGWPGQAHQGHAQAAGAPAQVGPQGTQAPQAEGEHHAHAGSDGEEAAHRAQVLTLADSVRRLALLPARSVAVTVNLIAGRRSFARRANARSRSLILIVFVCALVKRTVLAASLRLRSTTLIVTLLASLL